MVYGAGCAAINPSVVDKSRPLVDGFGLFIRKVDENGKFIAHVDLISLSCLIFEERT
jgi:hypothetical protein